MDYLNQNILLGSHCRYQFLINWCNSNIQHIDYDEKHLLVSTYSTYGALTGIGNLIPFAMSVVDTDFFRNDLMRKYSVSALLPVKHASLSHGIASYYALLLQYTVLDDGLDEHLKTFTKMSQKQLRVPQRGTMVTFNDLATKVQTSQAYHADICRVVQSIRQHYIP